jgi:hypothetical protein
MLTPRAQTPGASAPTDFAGLLFGASPRTAGICATVQPSLLARHPIPSGGDPVESGRAFAGVVLPAFLLDQSPSDLTKRLSSEHGDPRPMREEDILGIIESTQDVRPIYWLIEKYLQSPEAQKAQAIAQLAEVLPSILALVDAVTAGENKKGRHK